MLFEFMPLPLCPIKKRRKFTLVSHLLFGCSNHDTTVLRKGGQMCKHNLKLVITSAVLEDTFCECLPDKAPQQNSAGHPDRMQ